MGRENVRTACVILRLLLSIVPTTSSADPGNPEVVNTICGLGTVLRICDDYNFADDETIRWNGSRADTM